MTGQRSTGGFWRAFKHAFAIPKEDTLSAEETRWLERIADQVVRRGLTVPAIVLLESAKPLNFVGSQLLVFFKPVISFVFRPELCDRVAELMSRRGSSEALQRMIEERDQRRSRNGQRS